MAVTFVKSTTVGVDPDTVNEPVIFASPFLEPSHSAVAVTPVSCEPSPIWDPLKNEADTVEFIVK